ncbi:MAG: bifunctional aldolase/short-chain dehydrogenase [Nannocystaceae bacterium]
MRSAWSDDAASELLAELTERYPARCNRDVALRVYTSRLIGREPGLVLHGGGNTSVKTTLLDDLGEPCEVLCVKGSGWDLGAIDVPGLPAVRLRSLQALRRLDALDDAAMVNAARTRLLDASAPNPSVEALLHAFLPHRFIDHSHADAILSLVDQPGAKELAGEVFGGRLAVVPYVMPGFALAKLAAEVAEAHPECEGLLLLQHGLFTFGASARESYERHIAAVTAAERHIAGRRRAVDLGRAAATAADEAVSEARWSAWAPHIRGVLGLPDAGEGAASGGRRYVLHRRTSPAIRAFVDQPAARLLDLCARGPATPDHVIRTKQRPLVLDFAADLGGASLRRAFTAAIAAYRRSYAGYFRRQTEGRALARVALDPDPRVLLIPGVGLIGVGVDDRAARVAADLYEHTIAVITDAEAVGRYQALPEADIFDMEYWPLEQAKLGRKVERALGGRVVLISGAASGIGRACARRFAAAGAALFLVDRDAAPLAEVAAELGAAHAVVDVGDREAVARAVGACVRRYGGLDGLVANAGYAPQAAIAACPREVLEESLRVNLLGQQWLAAAATAVMRAQGRGGFLLFNASKAAFNPGRDFGPYAVAKAGVIALMKQYALEHGEEGIRSNAINADRVRTGLFPEDVVAARAQARGLAPDAYFRANLLRREVTADDVAEAFLYLACAPSTTAAVLTVDGGNIAASPR